MHGCCSSIVGTASFDWLYDSLTYHTYRAYPAGVRFTGLNGDLVYIDTTDPTKVSGVGADFWNRTIEFLSEAYATDIQLEWVLTPGESLTQLYTGDVEAVGPYAYPVGTWTTPDNDVVARTLYFSFFQCPFLFETVPIIAPVSSAINSFDALVQAIDESPEMFAVCVNGKRRADSSMKLVGLCTRSLTILHLF